MFNFRREIFAENFAEEATLKEAAERCQGYLHKYPTSGSRLRLLRTDHQPVASPHGFSVWRSETTYTIYIYYQHTHIYIYYVTICFMNLFYWIVCFGDTMGTLRYIPDFWSSIIQIVLEKHLHLGVNPRSAGKTATFNVFFVAVILPMGFNGFRV